MLVDLQTHVTFLQSVVSFAYFICGVKVILVLTYIDKLKGDLYFITVNRDVVYVYRVCTLHYFDVGCQK